MMHPDGMEAKTLVDKYYLGATTTTTTTTTTPAPLLWKKDLRVGSVRDRDLEGDRKRNVVEKKQVQKMMMIILLTGVIVSNNLQTTNNNNGNRNNNQRNAALFVREKVICLPKYENVRLFKIVQEKLHVLEQRRRRRRRRRRCC